MHDGRIEQMGTPREIYQTPEASFVADFVGSMNLIDATAGDDCHVETTFGQLALGERHGTSAGAPVTVGIRSEDLRLHPSGAEAGTVANRIAGSVVRTSFLGESQDVVVRLADTEVRVRVDGRRSITSDDAVVIEFPPDHLNVIV